MPEQRHFSIGEVLSLLKEEHVDITISKIRFFEGQGLIEPERTPSGYRKFYDSDIERLRWILVQQRDNFLPLKVIKRRLQEAGFDPAADMPPPDPTVHEPVLFAQRDDSAQVEKSEAEPEAEPASEADPEIEPAPEVEPETVSEEIASDEPDVEPEPEPEPEPAGSGTLSAGQLAEAAGIDLVFLAELDRMGLVETVTVEDGVGYGDEALVVAEAAASLQAHGLEPRHLRMFMVAAAREVGLLEQVVGAKLKLSGERQQVARAQLNEIVVLGETIQRSILRRTFGSHLD